eukprot:scaffold5138_cov125-Isochrysis_galbana.AAC.7
MGIRDGHGDAAAAAQRAASRGLLEHRTSRVVNATMDGSTVSWPPAPANHASLVAGAAILALCRPPSSAAVPPAAAIRCARNLCHSAASMVEPSPASSSTFARARPTSPKPHMTSASGETSVTCSSTGASLPSPVEPSRAAAPSVILRREGETRRGLGDEGSGR